jgi:hypothetical protein
VNDPGGLDSFLPARRKTGSGWAETGGSEGAFLSQFTQFDTAWAFGNLGNGGIAIGDAPISSGLISIPFSVAQAARISGTCLLPLALYERFHR